MTISDKFTEIDSKYCVIPVYLNNTTDLSKEPILDENNRLFFLLPEDLQHIIKAEISNIQFSSFYSVINIDSSKFIKPSNLICIVLTPKADLYDGLIQNHDDVRDKSKYLYNQAAFFYRAFRFCAESGLSPVVLPSKAEFNTPYIKQFFSDDVIIFDESILNNLIRCDMPELILSKTNLNTSIITKPEEFSYLFSFISNTYSPNQSTVTSSELFNVLFRNELKLRAPFLTVGHVSYDEDFLPPEYYCPDLLEKKIKEAEIQAKTFSQYLISLARSKGKSEVELYTGAHIDRKYFSKIRSNSRLPGRNMVKALCISLKLCIPEADELMKHAGYAFNDSDIGDVIVKFYIEHHIWDLYVINNSLQYFNQKILGSW